MIINVTLVFPQNIWYEDILGYIYSKSHNYFMMVSCALLVPTALKIQQRQSQNHFSLLHHTLPSSGTQTSRKPSLDKILSML